MRRSARAALAALAALSMATALAACSPETESAPVATVSPSPRASAMPSPSPAPAKDPEFQAEGSAFANRAYFDHVNERLFAESPDARGRDIIDNLVAAGFDKARMEVTADRTPLGNPTEAIEFSVGIGDDCLVGQWGHGEYSSIIAPVLGTGTCLVGATRTIDW